MKLSIQEIISATQARVLQKGTVQEITSVSTDSRALKRGDLFVAIKGPHFDGHDFVEEALAKGASGAVVRRSPARHASLAASRGEAGGSFVVRRPSPPPSPLGGEGRVRGESRPWVLEVEDTIHALGDIAAEWRKKLTGTVVAVTGSNGKSTTKEMIASAVSGVRRVVKTEENFNNLIGLPLQVLRASPEDEAIVLEMGMSAPGEIARLTEVASPGIGIITNVNPAHLASLNTIENVAAAKGELFKTMRQDGAIVVNVEDPWVRKLAEGYPGRRVCYGMQNGCDVQFGRMLKEGLDEISVTFWAKKREYAFILPAPGIHNVMNAMAAIAVGLVMGVQVTIMIEGLERFKPMKLRMERIQLSNGVQLINDSYNANPVSMHAALRTVGAAKRSGRFIAVLGDMLELGSESKARHFELGREAAGHGVNKLYAFGDFAGDVASGALEAGLNGAKISSSIEELTGELCKEIRTGDVVLVKGSRGMKMERIAEYLKDEIGV